MTWHIPEGLHPDVPALNVLTQALSDGVTSRLYQRLVETNRCLGVHAFTFELHDPGVLQVFATLAPGVDHGSVEAEIRDEIASLTETPLSGDELARALIQTRTDLAFHRESPAQIMSALTEAVAMGDWRRFPRELEAVSAVTSEDVGRVAGDYLGGTNLTAGWFVPQGGNGAASGRAPAPRPCYLHRPFADRVDVRDLSGGARLAVLSNPHAPTVTIAGTIGAGLDAATDGRFTVPSMTAAMLDRGTTSRDRLALATELEDHGLQLGVRAMGNSPTVVSFSAQGLAEELDRSGGSARRHSEIPGLPRRRARSSASADPGFPAQGTREHLGHGLFRAHPEPVSHGASLAQATGGGSGVRARRRSPERISRPFTPVPTGPSRW